MHKSAVRVPFRLFDELSSPDQSSLFKLQGCGDGIDNGGTEDTIKEVNVGSFREQL